MTRRFARWASLAMLLLCVTVVGRDSAPAAAPTKKPLKAGEFNPAHETVEMFDAIKAGQIDVRLIHKDSSGGKALISNKSGKPLNVKLPDAFAGVHVLAQMNGGQGMGIGGGMGQMSGGGMGGGGMGGGGMGGMGGGGGGMFNVAPEKVGEVPFTSVCLEHGKPEPRASMTYQIRAIDSVTKNKDLVEVLRLLNRGTMSQRVAQVLAWHLNNEMSFEELAAKRIEHLDGSSEPYFQLEEIRAAMAAKDYVAKQIAEREAAATTALPKL